MGDANDKDDVLDIEGDIDLVDEFEDAGPLPTAGSVESESVLELDENQESGEGLLDEVKLPEENSLPADSTEPEESAYEPVEEPAAGAAKRMSEELLKVAPDIPVNLVAVIGKVNTSVAELIELRQGYVVDLKRPPAETVDLVANGKLVARGELVEIDGRLGVRIEKLVR